MSLVTVPTAPWRLYFHKNKILEIIKKNQNLKATEIYLQKKTLTKPKNKHLFP